jgi:hypothetical protein
LGELPEVALEFVALHLRRRHGHLHRKT